MSDVRSLRGGCACGRNEYVVNVPSSSIKELQVLLDNSNLTRRTTTAPLTPFLRVPLDWYHSVTYAFFPDETHRTIRKTFAAGPDGSPAAQRQFCGFCGTQLSAWDERNADAARHISVTLGSLADEDVDTLEAWGLLSADDEDEDEEAEGGADEGNGAAAGARQQLAQRPVQGMAYRGTPWFEEMVEDSRLGRVRRQRGGYESRDGSEVVQWEVVELASDGTELPSDETFSAGKRKRGNSDGRAPGDVHMRG